MKRGSPGVAVATVASSAPPLPQLPPVYILGVALARPALQGSPVTNGPKHRLLPPGTYRITANIVIEGELTEEQLRALFVRSDRPAVERVERLTRPPDAEEAERKAQLFERVRQLIEVYRGRLGEPPEALAHALTAWVPEFGEAALRKAIDQTAAEPNLGSRHARYQYLREQLRIWRREGGPDGG